MRPVELVLPGGFFVHCTGTGAALQWDELSGVEHEYRRRMLVGTFGRDARRADDAQRIGDVVFGSANHQSNIIAPEKPTGAAEFRHVKTGIVKTPHQGGTVIATNNREK